MADHQRTESKDTIESKESDKIESGSERGRRDSEVDGSDRENVRSFLASQSTTSLDLHSSTTETWLTMYVLVGHV